MNEGLGELRVSQTLFYIQAEGLHRTSSGTDLRTGKREKQNAKQRKRNRSMGKRNTG